MKLKLKKKEWNRKLMTMVKGKKIPTDISRMNSDVLWSIIRKPYRMDSSCNIAVIGKTGGGKSTVAQFLGFMLSRKGKEFNFDFHPETDVHFRYIDFLIAVRKLKKHRNKGKVIIFEEAGTQEAIFNRNWYSEINKSASELMQIARNKNAILIFVLPSLKYLDTHVRDFFNIQFECKDKSIPQKTTIVRVKEVFKNFETDDTYNKYFRYINKKKGTTQSIAEWEVPKPPRYIVESWKEIEIENKNILMDKAIARIKANEEKAQEKQEVSIEEKYKELLGKLNLVVKKGAKETRPTISKKLIEVRLKVNSASATALKDMVDNAIYMGELDIEAI